MEYLKLELKSVLSLQIWAIPYWRFDDYLLFIDYPGYYRVNISQYDEKAELVDVVFS